MNVTNLVRSVPQKWQNHLYLLVRYGSFRKFVNLAKCLMAYSLSQARLNAFPPFLKVEASNECRVFCRYCIASKSGAKFSLDRFETLIELLGPYAFEVSLHDIGEPLLHDEIIDFIQCAHSRRVGTIISSSLSIERPDEFWHHLAASGLDRLVAAIDGITEETYTAYRTHGNLPLVLGNLEKLIRYRRESRSFLKITWQMVDLPWNRSEQARAREMARELGCDRFQLISEETLKRMDYFRQKQLRTRACLMPFLMLVVTASGKVRPCCNIYRGVTDSISHENLVGDIIAQTFEGIWNSPEMQTIRNPHLIATRPYCNYCREM
jgi:MoaA/NifB/PqqE/SkfB family radical SAM enzyme